MAQVTYAIELIPENAGKIDAINRIILGESYTAEAPATTGRGMVEEIEKSTEAKKQKSADTATEQGSSTKSKGKAASAKVTFDTFKVTAKKAKADHGEDFVKEMIEQAGAELKSTLLKSVSAVDAELRQEIMDLWIAGPTEQAADEPEDDLDDDLDDDLEDDGLGDDDADIDPEAVKTALKAYSKSEGREAAKEIMTKNGATALSKVNDCSQKQLAAMMKALV